MDKFPRNQIIAKVNMTSNHMFPLRIRLDMKGKIVQVVDDTRNVNYGATFKVENTKTAVATDSSKIAQSNSKEEKDCCVETQSTFQLVVKDESQLCHFRFGHLNFGGIKLLCI